MVCFVFFGRLSKEKGIDILINALLNLPKEMNICVDIFGDGPMRESIIKVCQSLSFVRYHGFTSQEVIFNHLKTRAHYTLMPSIFLETFGLSALESLAQGVPVIGIPKGGLEPFIHESLRIEETAESLKEKIQEKSKYDESERKSCKQRALEIANAYTPMKRKENVKKVISLSYNLQPKKELQKTETQRTFFQENRHEKTKILLISDYSTLIGGIETYVRNSANLLNSSNEYVAVTAGYALPSGKWQKVRRYAGLLVAFCNIPSAWKLSKIRKKEKPDIIRWHSVVRLIGPVGVRSCRKNAIQRIMYHDLGYFHPYPSLITNIEQLPDKRCLFSFIKAGWKSMGGNSIKKIMKKILYTPCMLYKFAYLSILRKILRKHITIHLVPSDFMKPLVEKLYNVPKDNIFVLPHFVGNIFH